VNLLLWAHEAPVVIWFVLELKPNEGSVSGKRATHVCKRVSGSTSERIRRGRSAYVHRL